MPKTDGKASVIVVSENQDLFNDILAALHNENEFLVLKQLKDKQEILAEVAKFQPEILLVDFLLFKEKTYAFIDKIASQYPAVAIVVTLPESEVHFSDKVILSGARAFILYPFARKNLLTTLRRVVELLKRNFPNLPTLETSAAVSVKPRNTFTVFSPKGGAGCSSIAVNLAIGLRQLNKESILLVDGKHLFGHIALMLNLRTGNSITDLISHAGMLDKQLINQVVVDHISGIRVLPSPSTVTEAQGIRPEDLYRVITELQSVFSTIIIDGGNFLQENTITYMDASERIIAIINPNLASIRDFRQFLDLCTSLSYPSEKIMLVLNNIGHKSDIQKEEIEKILKTKVLCEIPADENFALGAINEGVPMILKNPRHPVSKAIQNLASIVRNEINEMNTAYSMTESGAVKEMLRKTSKLG